MRKEVRELLATLVDQGWEVVRDRGKHPVLRHTTTGAMMSVPTSPSDGRSLANCLAEARRKAMVLASPAMEATEEEPTPPTPQKRRRIALPQGERRARTHRVTPAKSTVVDVRGRTRELARQHAAPASMGPGPGTIRVIRVDDPWQQTLLLQVGDTVTLATMDGASVVLHQPGRPEVALDPVPSAALLNLMQRQRYCQFGAVVVLAHGVEALRLAFLDTLPHGAETVLDTGVATHTGDALWARYVADVEQWLKRLEEPVERTRFRRQIRQALGIELSEDLEVVGGAVPGGLDLVRVR